MKRQRQAKDLGGCFTTDGRLPGVTRRSPWMLRGQCAAKLSQRKTCVTNLSGSLFAFVANSFVELCMRQGVHERHLWGQQYRPQQDEQSP